jgi:hypothetical protein
MRPPDPAQGIDGASRSHARWLGRWWRGTRELLGKERSASSGAPSYASMATEARPKEAASSEAALIAIYQMDQERISAVGNVTLTILGAGLTYLVATAPFARSLAETLAKQFPRSDWVPGTFLASLPLLLFIIASYHSLLTLEAIFRTVSARAIEVELLSIAHLDPEKVRFGAGASDYVLDLRQQPIRFKLATGISYGGIVLIVAVYAVAMLIMSVHYIHKEVWIPVVVYSVLTVLIAQSWLYGLAKARKAQDVAYLKSGKSLSTE